MKKLFLLALIASALPASLVQTQTTVGAAGPCTQRQGSVQSGISLDANRLVITAASSPSPTDIDFGVYSCTVTIAGTISTHGPIRDGFIEFAATGDVNATLISSSGASFSMPGLINVTCLQSCGPTRTFPIQIGIGLNLIATATGDRGLLGRGGGAHISQTIRIYEYVQPDPNNIGTRREQNVQILLNDPTPQAVPEPTTFALAAGALAALAWRRKANPKP